MNCEKLPRDYVRTATIHLEKDKLHKRSVSLIAMILAVGLAMLGHALHPFDETVIALLSKVWVLMALLAVLFASMVLHEGIHGLMMFLFSRVKPQFAVKGLYCYVGSAVHFDRRSYVLISLAPVCIWGAVLLALYFILPGEWFWAVHIVQIANFANAAGDFYSIGCVLRQDKTSLIQGLGNGMKIYAPDRK